ncbi:MAG: hypothetical protein AAGU74_15085 [Bacillota bacterium]
MARDMQNPKCRFNETDYCELLNMPSCKECSIANISDTEQTDEIQKDLDVLMSLIPEEGISSLFEGQTCKLCADGNPRPRTCYVITDIGHPEPKRVKRNILGFKSRAKVGSLIPIQISCCARCRKNFLVYEYLPIALMLLLPAIALIVLSIQDVSFALAKIHEFLPFLIFVVSIVVGWGLGRIIKALYKKSKSRETLFDIWQLPLMQKLKKIGWEPLSDDKNGSRVIFTKKRIARGVYTSETMPGRAGNAD